LAGKPDGWFTRAEAARKIGRSKDTVTRWHKNGNYEATNFYMAGKTPVWIYSADDITKMKELAKTIKSGPKPKTE
jgi:hypothetical protein